jgi:hypothetical protein
MTERPDIEGFLALAGKATPEPWDVIDPEDDLIRIVYYDMDADDQGCAVPSRDDICLMEDTKSDADNAAFIAAAKNTAPAIAQYALAVEKERDDWKTAATASAALTEKASEIAGRFEAHNTAVADAALEVLRTLEAVRYSVGLGPTQIARMGKLRTLIGEKP